MTDENEIVKLLEEYNQLRELYLSNFGEDSLDDIFLFDPHGCENHPEEISEGIDILKKSIGSNTPIGEEHKYPQGAIF